MAYNNKLLSKFNLTGKLPADAETDADVMADASYLRQSSALINDALQKGFDVLQLADGDIVMTGVKTVVYQYTWDEEKKKLVRTKAKSAKKRTALSAPKIDIDEESFDDEEEDA